MSDMSLAWSHFIYGVFGRWLLAIYGFVGSVEPICLQRFSNRRASLDGFLCRYPHYNIEVDSIQVGNESIPVNEVSLFDTGTTTTFLTSTVYNAVIAAVSLLNQSVVGFMHVPFIVQ